MHIENFSAWHKVEVGNKENGMGGTDTRFTFNTPLHVRHLTMLGDPAKRGEFTYAGRQNQAEAKFSSGECAMLTSSSGAQANIRRNATFDSPVSVPPSPAHLPPPPPTSPPPLPPPAVPLPTT